MIKYCDWCKFNTITYSKAIPEDKTEDNIKTCPICDQELFEADNYDDIL